MRHRILRTLWQTAAHNAKINICITDSCRGRETQLDTQYSQFQDIECIGTAGAPCAPPKQCCEQQEAHKPQTWKLMQGMMLHLKCLTLKDVYIITGSLMKPLLCLYDLLVVHKIYSNKMFMYPPPPPPPLQKQTTTKNNCGRSVSQKTFWVTQKLSSASLCWALYQFFPDRNYEHKN